MRRFARLCLVMLAALVFGNANGQPLATNFDNITTLPGAGWVFTNNSAAPGAVGWFQGNSAVFSSQTGAANSYVAGNFNAAAFGGNISLWAITPTLTNLRNGAVLTFYTRTETAAPAADRLEVRLSTNGASSNVGATDVSVGDFTTLLLAINPTLALAGYPATWTQFSVTLSGLPAGPNTGRIGLRYFVTDTSTNGDYIGIDTLNLTNYYTVSFDSNGGSSVVSQVIAEGGTATAPTAPTRAGSVFAGWYADAGLSIAFSFTTPIIADTTLYAKWLLLQNISFGPLANRTFGEAPFTVSASGGSSGNPVTFSSTTTSVCTVSSNTVTLVAAGTCTIAANQAGNATYLPAAQVTQSFTVTGLFRAYLSRNGVDTNPCTLALPCRLLPAALAVVREGGEIWILNSANFNTGLVDITKSVTILAVPGALGSVVANGADAIRINGPNVEVTLRNLVVLNLNGAGNAGIQFIQGSQLTVEGCEIYGLGQGIVAGAAGGLLNVQDTTIRDIVNTGVYLQGTVSALLDRVALLNNAFMGIYVSGDAQAQVANSTISGSITGAIASASVGRTARLTLTDTTLSGNSNAVVVSTTATGDTAHAVLESVTITHNGVGVTLSGAGTKAVFTRQDNTFKFNGTDVSGGTLTPQGGL